MSAALKSLMDRLAEVTPQLSNNWKSQTAKHGWDDHLSNSIAVTLDKDTAGLHIPSSLEPAVANAEYGDVETGAPPRPAIRSFEVSSKQTVSNAIYQGLCDYLGSAGLI